MLVSKLKYFVVGHKLQSNLSLRENQIFKTVSDINQYMVLE